MSDPDLSIGSPNDLGHRHEIELRNAAIEECAQEIERITEGSAYPLTVELARQMAAAIRALKAR